jgi:deoxyribodipyrimidine photolyase-related protein
MNCLDEVVASVVEEGHSHHITRLMVLSNLAALLDIDPREITDWFWVMYIDAYDWVVEPNVLGMGTFALADLFTTKPYVSGSNYIAKMSDYCSSCRFDPKKNCPIQSLYWAFLDRHEQTLTNQGRMNLMYGMLRRRGSEKRIADQVVFEVVSALLKAGKTLSPEHIRQGIEDI